MAYNALSSFSPNAYFLAMLGRYGGFLMVETALTGLNRSFDVVEFDVHVWRNLAGKLYANEPRFEDLTVGLPGRYCDVKMSCHLVVACTCTLSAGGGRLAHHGTATMFRPAVKLASAGRRRNLQQYSLTIKVDRSGHCGIMRRPWIVFNLDPYFTLHFKSSLSPNKLRSCNSSR